MTAIKRCYVQYLWDLYSCMEEEVSRMPSKNNGSIWNIWKKCRYLLFKKSYFCLFFFIPVFSAPSDKQCEYVVRRISSGKNASGLDPYFVVKWILAVKLFCRTQTKGSWGDWGNPEVFFVFVRRASGELGNFRSNTRSSFSWPAMSWTLGITRKVAVTSEVGGWNQNSATTLSNSPAPWIAGLTFKLSLSGTSKSLMEGKPQQLLAVFLAASINISD